MWLRNARSNGTRVDEIFKAVGLVGWEGKRSCVASTPTPSQTFGTIPSPTPTETAGTPTRPLLESSFPRYTTFGRASSKGPQREPRTLGWTPSTLGGYSSWLFHLVGSLRERIRLTVWMDGWMDRKTVEPASIWVLTTAVEPVRDKINGQRAIPPTNKTLRDATVQRLTHGSGWLRRVGSRCDCGDSSFAALADGKTDPNPPPPPSTPGKPTSEIHGSTFINMGWRSDEPAEDMIVNNTFCCYAEAVGVISCIPPPPYPSQYHLRKRGFVTQRYTLEQDYHYTNTLPKGKSTPPDCSRRIEDGRMGRLYPYRKSRV
ncbi:hypothetical protein ONZ45_g11723 [Pleurotus djamor]|nr:hypothetical protein ONZ45_g11723 [Pleurotus djamor]